VTGDVRDNRRVRVLVAPSAFAGTLTAVQAAEAITAGWRRRAPRDEIVQVPMSDGGPGFVRTLHASLGGDLVPVLVHDQYGSAVPGVLLGVGETTYVESSQACGLYLSDRRDGEDASSFGAGELLAAAVEGGARRVVVGVGDTGSNDAGAGLLAALGGTSHPEGALMRGPRSLEQLETVDLSRAFRRCAGVEMVAASDLDIPLLGLRGTTNAHGERRGIADERRLHVDAQLARFAEATDRRLADAKGAGAGGGIGFALMLLGGTRVDGVELVTSLVGLPELARRADLVVTGEGSFDFSSRSGKVPYGVAAVAGAAIRPCIALAGEVLVGSREMRALGIESAYSVVDLVGREAALADPAESLSALAERVARSWSR
jgi:glycerate kinase